MRQLILVSPILLVRIVPAGALAQSCEEEVGDEFAATYFEQCLDVSPATHPPCNVENSCEADPG